MLEQLKTNIDQYAKGKSWYWYAPMWLFGLYIFIQLLNFELGGQLPFIIAIPQAFNFILHEMAHVFWAFAPDVITAAAGSASELLLGAVLIWGAFKGRTYFASLFCFLWFMLASQSAADYMSDARSQSLPLVNFDVSGAAPIHDWNFVFTKLGILEMDSLIGGTVRTVGVFAGLFGLAFAAWLMYMMAGASDKQALNEQEAMLLHKTASEAGLHAAPPKHFADLKEGSLYPTARKGRLSADSDKKPENPKE